MRRLASPTAAIHAKLLLLIALSFPVVVGTFWAFRQQRGVPASVETKFRKPEAYDFRAIYERALGECPTRVARCFDAALDRITRAHGPQASLDLLRLLHADGLVSSAVDYHPVAHRAGRITAREFGINGEAFLLCPTSFNYGCQHGFLEYALGRASSIREAVHLICGSLEADPARSAKFKFYCYHGAGHGVLMAQAYDLPAALATCDALETPVGQDGCWQGVFMENVGAAARGEARQGVFSATDPLAPCNRVAEKHRHECFINHAGWLMHIFGNDVAKAARACLEAPESYVASCLQSIGLMATNPGSQTNLLKNPRGGTFETIAWEICLKFPAQHRDQCVLGAVDNILNFDELDVSRARAFCATVGSAYAAPCHERVGWNLRNQATDPSIVLKKCAGLEPSLREACLRGARL